MKTRVTMRRGGIGVGWLALAMLAAPVAAQQETSMPTAPAPPEDTSSEQVITLEQALAMARENSPLIAQSQGQVETAKWGERTALGAYLPTLSLSTGSSLASTQRFSSETNTTVNGSARSYSAGLSASMDLFDGGARGADRRAAKAQTASARASLTEQQFSVALSTKQAYFNVRRADQLIALAQSQIETSQQSLDAAERRLQVGSATRSDVLRAQLQLNTSKQSLLSAQNQHRTAAYALGRLVGVDGPVGASTLESLDPTPLAVSPDQLVSELVNKAPTILTAEADVVSTHARTSAARTAFLPSLRLSAGNNWNNDALDFSSGRTSWNIRLGLSYPIFNGFQRVSSVETAQVQERVAEAQLADAKRQVRATAEQYVGALNLAQQQIALAEEAVAAATEDLRVQQTRYEVGATTILDLITSQAAVQQAESDLVNARFDYQVARAQLEALAGRDL